MPCMDDDAGQIELHTSIPACIAKEVKAVPDAETLAKTWQSVLQITCRWLSWLCTSIDTLVQRRSACEGTRSCCDVANKHEAAPSRYDQQQAFRQGIDGAKQSRCARGRRLTDNSALITTSLAPCQLQKPKLI